MAKKDHHWKTRMLLYLSSILVGITFITSNLNWLIFISLLPLILYVVNINEYSPRAVKLDFYLSGLLLNFFAYFFFFQMAPQNWTVTLTGWFAIGSRLIAWLVVAGFGSLPFLLFAFVLPKIQNQTLRVMSLLIFIPLIELIRSYAVSLTNYGPGASIAPNYNFGSIAVTTAATQLVYLSRFMGFYGLTFAVVAINLSLFFLFFKKRYLLSLSIFFVITVTTYLGWKQGDVTNTRSIKVAIVHLSESDDLEKWKGIQWPDQGTDLLVLPEYSEFMKNADKSKISARLSEQGIGVTSVSVGESPSATNQMQIFNNNADVLNHQDKTFLIPTGEYMPYSGQIAFNIVRQKNALLDFRYTQQVSPGQVAERPYKSSNFTAGALICSGVGALNEYERLSNEGADILTNSASLSFLGRDSFYRIFGKNMARYHAVSNNKPFIQASRSDQSYAIDNQGKFLIGSQTDNTQLLTATIAIDAN